MKSMTLFSIDSYKKHALITMQTTLLMRKKYHNKAYSIKFLNPSKSTRMPLETVKVGVPKKVVFTKISTHVSVSNKSIS
jgi:hypothetical protein